MACLNQFCSFIAYLLETNEVNEIKCNTFACVATLDGKAEVAKVLLDGGANVNTHDKQGRSVLMVRRFHL